MDDGLVSWHRPHFSPGGANPRVSLVVYGEFENLDFIPPPGYRTAGIPEGVGLIRENRYQNAEAAEKLWSRKLWELGARRKPRGAKLAERAPEALLFYGEVSNPESLDYLRDLVGFVMYLLESGGTVAYALPTVMFWMREEWEAALFAPNAPVPTRHVEVVETPEDDGSHMYQTLGMQIFGRPELCVRWAGRRYESALVTLLKKYIEFQAYGGALRQGEKVRSFGLPEGGRARYVSNPNDPTAPEQVVEFVWPEGVLANPWWWFW